MSNKDINFRTRNFFFLLYPKEDETHANALEFIQQYYDYIAINHDRDIDSNGDLKKEHTHVIVKFHNPRYRNSVCKELGIETNYCRSIKKYNDSLLYLIHFEDFSKFNYDVTECFGNLVKDLDILLKQTNVTDDYILDFIYSIELKYVGCVMTFSDIKKEFIEHDLLPFYAKYYRFVRDVVIQHNYILKL